MKEDRDKKIQRIVSKPGEELMSLEEYFLFRSPIPFKDTAIYAHIKGHGHGRGGRGGCCCCCCCCCCCSSSSCSGKGKEPTIEPPTTGKPGPLTVRWTGPVTHSIQGVIGPTGMISLTKQIRATMGWEANRTTARVSIWARIRGVFVNYRTAWKEVVSDEDYRDSVLYLPITQYDVPMKNPTLYVIQYEARAIDPATGETARSPIQDKQVTLERTPPPTIL